MTLWAQTVMANLFGIVCQVYFKGESCWCQTKCPLKLNLAVWVKCKALTSKKLKLRPLSFQWIPCCLTGDGIFLFVNRSTWQHTQLIAVADQLKNWNLLHILLSFSFCHFLFFPLSKEILLCFSTLFPFSLLAICFDMKGKVLINH